MTPTRLSKTAMIALIVAALCADSTPNLATCGGGGVGGARPGGALGVYWFPASAAEDRASNLMTSRTLRDDVAFDPLKREAEFLSMTSLADRDAAPHR